MRLRGIPHLSAQIDVISIYFREEVIEGGIIVTWSNQILKI